MKKQNGSWVLGSLLLVGLGIGLLGAPSQWEGPALIRISPGHALSLLDMIGVAPILIGMSLLYAGLWQRRQRLYEAIQKAPQASGAGILIAGLGLGLLLASSFSAFFWWWAVGALLFGAMLLLALRAAT